MTLAVPEQVTIAPGFAPVTVSTSFVPDNSTAQWRGVPLAKWYERGLRALNDQREQVGKFSNYYDGLPYGTTLQGDQRDIFARLLRETRTNWCELVVNAVAERLAVQWFRFGAGDTIDQQAWDIWQASSMDADSEMVQTDALVTGNSFVSVLPDDESPVGVTISPEHPAQTVCLYPNGRPRRSPLAALRRIGDEDDPGNVLTYFVTPDFVAVFDGETMRPELQDNPLGFVPYVEVTPSPRTMGLPRSELHSAAPIQDRINTQIYNRLVASDFGAFRQIFATGLALARNEDGSYKRPYDVGADRLLVNTNPEGRFGVIPESNLSGYLEAVQADVMHLAAITQTPPHYLLGQISNISGDALKGAETGLVAKVRRRAAHIGEAWEQVMRLAMRTVGVSVENDYTAEVVWRDFETRSESQLADQLVKMSSIRVPDEALWERWGASPQTIARWREMNAANAAASTTDTANPAPPATEDPTPVGADA